EADGTARRARRGRRPTGRTRPATGGAGVREPISDWGSGGHRRRGLLANAVRLHYTSRMTADVPADSAAAVPTIRPARKDDVPGVHAFIRPYVAAGRLLERTMEELDLLVADGFVAEHEGRIVGFAALEIYSKKLAELRSLAVDDAFRGMGLGRRLVNACIERAREEHVFEVMAITSSEEFFRSCGFDFTLPGEKKALFLQTREEH